MKEKHEELLRQLEEVAAGYNTDGEQVVQIVDANELLKVEDVKKMLEQKYDPTARIHHVIVSEPTAQTIDSGIQPFVVTANTEGFQRGDFIKFIVKTISGINVAYHPLRKKSFKITYVHSGIGLKEGFVCLGFEETDLLEKTDE